jgi:uncharacterized protein YndB with AHSA1/START domain
LQLSIRRTLNFDAARERVFAAVTAPENLPLFTGYGPIPGVLEARPDGPLGTGTEFSVRNRDGSRHRERIELHDPPAHYRIRIFGFDSSFRLLVAHAVERLDFVEHGGRTSVEREFCFTLTSVLLLPIALPLLYVFFARALDINYARLREHIEAARAVSP